MKKHRLLLLLSIIVLLFTACSIEISIPSASVPIVAEEELIVHFIDVGQGDAILIQAGKSTMLIDAGDNHYGKTVVSYIEQQDIDRIDYVIGTHPHADHIGGLDDVILAFDIGEVIMPKVTHTTKTYEDVLDAVASKNMKITSAHAGQSFLLGSAQVSILSPIKESYKNLNEYSVVTHLIHGENSFLFMGDAETYNEKELLSAGTVPRANVLKSGHHGSSSSTSQQFLDAVAPEYVILLLGENNQYGHPHRETLQKLEGYHILRTDLHGTIILKSDGNSLTQAA